jgi:DMSO/TMAO reductase YedYZ molybdopterin-dependent catalytic subunit
MAVDRSETPREVPSDGLPLGRLAFLGTVAAGVAGIAVAPRISGAVNNAISGASSALGGLAPPSGWRIYAVASPMPRFDPRTYTLVVDGQVAGPRTLGWKEVAALPGEHQVSRFHCVTGWTVDGVRWEGIRSRTLVDLVQPHRDARWVTFHSLEEPYVDQISLDQFLLSDVMLARHMDGRPLTRAHGAPLRLVIPKMYGYKGVKWVNRVTFDREQASGYWEQRGYDVDAWVGRSNGY